VRVSSAKRCRAQGTNWRIESHKKMQHESLGRIESLLEGAVAGMADLEGLASLGETAWLIVFTDASSLAIDWRSPGTNLCLSAAVGRPPVDRRFLAYEALLCFNALRADHAIVASLHGPDGEVVLQTEVSTRKLLAPADLLEVLQPFLDAMRRWREFIERQSQELRVPDLMLQMFDMRA
jgi:hypothetical protein